MDSCLRRNDERGCRIHGRGRNDECRDLPDFREKSETKGATTNSRPKIILIGGSSHVGKSTLAESVAIELGWNQISTDSLARHPGRPWASPPNKVPDNVADHYVNLSVDELIEDVLQHYKLNVWPKVEAIVASHLSDPTASGMVLEGSALWPDFASNLDFTEVAAIWLTATNELFQLRIHANSQYAARSPRERTLIDKFLERTLVYDERMVDAVNRHGFVLLDVSRSDIAELTRTCLSTLGAKGT